MKKIAIFGSTGSIGVQAVSVIEKYPERFKVSVLTCGMNLELLREQIIRLRPAIAVIGGAAPSAMAGAGGVSTLRGAGDSSALSSVNASGVAALVREFPEVRFLTGAAGLAEAAEHGDYDLMLNALSGAAGLIPTWNAIVTNRDIAIANKETLVAGGKQVMAEAARRKLRILPVDSEHSAIFQALQGGNGNKPKRILLTASGGPFRGFSKAMLRNATLEQALAHPKWNMGSKITVDSATMMNKGLEIIEAGWLFDLPSEKIEVLVHPQCIVHSMVEFGDASVIAQMGAPDMKTPIAYALAYPERIDAGAQALDFTALSGLTFEHVDDNVFTCLRMAREAMTDGGSRPITLNAANEVLVGLFLEKRIGFMDIQENLERLMQSHISVNVNDVYDVMKLDGEVRAKLKEMLCL